MGFYPFRGLDASFTLTTILSRSREAVAKLLGSDAQVHVAVIAFVGDFEGNAYTFSGPDGPTVAVEIEDADAGLKLTHEFTHVVEAEQANLSLDWKRTLAHTIFAEGLAVSVVHRPHPELTEAACVGEVTGN